jgi:Na+-driven multidrug efflux pump
MKDSAGNTMFIVFALTQVLGVGTVALISHAVGRKDRSDATLVFNQSLLLSTSCALGVVLLALYFHRLEQYVAFEPTAWRPQLATWRRLLRIGLPAVGEFALMFVTLQALLSLWLVRGEFRRRLAGAAAASPA